MCAKRVNATFQSTNSNQLSQKSAHRQTVASAETAECNLTARYLSQAFLQTLERRSICYFWQRIKNRKIARPTANTPYVEASKSFGFLRSSQPIINLPVCASVNKAFQMQTVPTKILNKLCAQQDHLKKSYSQHVAATNVVNIADPMLSWYSSKDFPTRKAMNTLWSHQFLPEGH